MIAHLNSPVKEGPESHANQSIRQERRERRIDLSFEEHQHARKRRKRKQSHGRYGRPRLRHLRPVPMDDQEPRVPVQQEDDEDKPPHGLPKLFSLSQLNTLSPRLTLWIEHSPPPLHSGSRFLLASPHP